MIHEKWVVVWNVIYFHPYFGKDEPIFDEHIFQRGWFNHQLEKSSSRASFFGKFASEALRSTPQKKPTLKDPTTVDGRNPAPADMVNIPGFTGF